MTGKLKLLLYNFIGPILLGCVILVRADAGLSNQARFLPCDLEQTFIVKSLNPADWDAHFLFSNGDIRQANKLISLKYPQNPEGQCDKKPSWKKITTVPCGSAWGG